MHFPSKILREQNWIFLILKYSKAILVKFFLALKYALGVRSKESEVSEIEVRFFIAMKSSLGVECKKSILV